MTSVVFALAKYDGVMNFVGLDYGFVEGLKTRFFVHCFSRCKTVLKCLYNGPRNIAQVTSIVFDFVISLQNEASHSQFRGFFTMPANFKSKYRRPDAISCSKS